MKNVSRNDIQRLENALKQIHSHGESAPEPSDHWQQNVMREVRSLNMSIETAGDAFLLLKELCWPAVQLALTLIVLVGIYLLNDSSLTNLDMALFYTDLPLSVDSLISYYSF